MSKYDRMSEALLRELYVPDIYQKSIYDIDYDKLKKKGIKLISFDMDDTIDACLNIRAPGYRPPKLAITFFQKLKADGFTIVLITNAQDNLGEVFAEQLGVDDCVTRALKPRADSFVKIMEKYGITEVQMAHVGNSILNDIGGAKTARLAHTGNTCQKTSLEHITTCLVRDVGEKLSTVGHGVQAIFGYSSEGKKLRKALKDRGIWRKHHKYQEGDQYYQLGEEPGYRTDDLFVAFSD